MYNQDRFIQIINECKGDKTFSEYGESIGVDGAYLWRIVNKKKNNPPSPEIWVKFAKISNNITTYHELAEICGYYDEMVYEYQLLLDGKVEYADLLFGKDTDIDVKIQRINELIEGLKNYIEDCKEQVKVLEDNEVYKIIRKDTINVQKDEIRRTNEKINGLKNIKKELENQKQ